MVWANKALEKLRRRLAAELRATGATELVATRWAMIKKSEDLTSGQRTTIAALAQLNSAPHRGYLMKEQLREIFKAGPAAASRCRPG